jgi:hypothetical protein
MSVVTKLGSILKQYGSRLKVISFTQAAFFCVKEKLFVFVHFLRNGRINKFDQEVFTFFPIAYFLLLPLVLFILNSFINR